MQFTVKCPPRGKFPELALIFFNIVFVGVLLELRLE